MTTTNHLAILNGRETTAKLVHGRWLVGGDVVQTGDNVLIAAIEFSSRRLAWHKLRGNRLVFDDFLTEEEIEKNNEL